MRLAFFGTSEFAVPILDKLAQSQWRPELVVSTPDAPAGRSYRILPPPVKLAAARLNLPIIQPGSISFIPSSLADQSWDLFIAAAYGKILPQALLDLPKRGSLNVHPSLLPRWRGPSPVQYTIFHGDTETGVTILLMDEQADHGPILKNSKFEIRNSKLTSPELTKILAEQGAQLLLDDIPSWLSSEITPRPQDDSRVTYAKLLKKEDGLIDWAKPAVEIERMVRAFSPWPGAYTFWPRAKNRVRLNIEAAEAVEYGAIQLSGTVLRYRNNFAVACVKGLLVISRLRPAGKVSMSGAEFLNGYRDILGAVLDSNFSRL